MIRVNQAGEIGARRICEGQLAVLRDPHARQLVQEILECEKGHLSHFEQLIAQRRVRPSMFHPLWNAAAYAVGMGTALLGPKAAMACHEAVETVITEHYNNQLRDLHETGLASVETELKDRIKTFRDEEEGHRDIGTQNGAAEAPLYRVLSNVIKTGCRVAIAVAERV
jgi:ubiquinone biosynthesis monooxygenase Coq7